MAIVDGTNAGFVSSRPVSDPSGSAAYQIDTRADAERFTSPAGTNSISEIGWWASQATEEANFEVGIYSHDAGNDLPNVLLASNKTNAKGTTEGWKYGSVSYDLTASTTYWLAAQLDDTATTTQVDVTSNAGYKQAVKSGVTTLPDPNWSNTTTNAYIMAIYALYSAGTSSTIFIGRSIGVGIGMGILN